MPLDTLRAMGADIEGALERINVPTYVLDRVGVVRWMNEAARNLVGEQVGRQFTSVVAPEETRRARELFARKILGNTEVTDASIVVVDADGAHVSVEISSVPLKRGEHVVGVFGQVLDILEEPRLHPELHLTPRQAEVLRLLERGRSTAQIAEDLQLAARRCATTFVICCTRWELRRGSRRSPSHAALIDAIASTSGRGAAAILAAWTI